MAHRPVLPLLRAKALLTLIGTEYGLGRVAGYDAAETTDEDPSGWPQLPGSPDYLRTKLYPGGFGLAGSA